MACWIMIAIRCCDAGAHEAILLVYEYSTRATENRRHAEYAKCCIICN